MNWFLAGLEAAGARGQGVDAFAAQLHDTAAARGARHNTVQEALQAAHAQARSDDRVLVFGSFHTVAEALAILHSGQ